MSDTTTGVARLNAIFGFTAEDAETMRQSRRAETTGRERARRRRLNRIAAKSRRRNRGR